MFGFSTVFNIGLVIGLVIVVICGGVKTGLSSPPSKSANTPVQMGGAIQGNPLTSAKAVSTIAGVTLDFENSFADGTGDTARFNFINGITTDGTNLYVVDSGNNIIRKIVIATGAVTTIAGTVGEKGSADGIYTAASFEPTDITTDGTNLYIADGSNCTIRKMVLATGAVMTIVGTTGQQGSADRTGAMARFGYPTGITTDGTNLYVADYGNDTIRKIVIATKVVTTIAGKPKQKGFADGTGSMARFNSPHSITTDGTNLYVTDNMNYTIRKIVIATGEVTTLAGTAKKYGFADGVGVTASFYDPRGITTDGTNLYVVDSGNSIIRKIAIDTGIVTTIAGRAKNYGIASPCRHPDGPISAASFSYPEGITTDGTSLYVTDSGASKTIRKIQ